MLAAVGTGMARKEWATVPYTFMGKQTVLGPNGTPGTWSIGSQVLFSLAMRSSSDGAVGVLSGHCHVAAPRADGWLAVCTMHYDWADGSTMTGHVTLTMRPDGSPVKGRLVIAGVTLLL